MSQRVWIGGLVAFLIGGYCAVASSSFFSIDPVDSGLRSYNGILYTKSGSLALAGTVDPSVSMIVFSGTTSTGGVVYATGAALSVINARYPSNTSLTGGTYVISGLNSSGAILGSETLVIDKSAPRMGSITYFDDNRNGRVDRLVVSTDEALTGTLALPYSTGMTIYTRRGGLVSSGASSNLDFSDHISSVTLSGSDLVLGLTEWDMIRPSLRINTTAGSSASDLKFGLYTNATVTDIAGNVATLATSKFPNSATGIVNGMNGIDSLDVGYLYGSDFSGSLSVDAIDSRGISWPLMLSGVVLSVASDSHIGDGNVLIIGTGSQLVGDTILLSLGSESRLESATGGVIAAKSGFSSSFRTLSGTILSDVSELSQDVIVYAYEGTLTGSGFSLIIDYVFDSGSVESVYSGSLLGLNTTIPLTHGFSWWHLRARIVQDFSSGTTLSGVTIVSDELVSPSVTFVASVVSTGSVSDITWNTARLSGVRFRPDSNGTISYGTGLLDHTGSVTSGVFDFTGLSPSATYFYRLGFVPFVSWSEVVSDTGAFVTTAAPRTPPSILFAFQNTTYLTDQDTTLSEFTCDTTHADCRVNFDLSSSFVGDPNSDEFFCELDFDLDLESGEEYKCNPNTVTFPRGHDYHLRFRIINSLDTSLASERFITINAPLLSSPSTSSGSTDSGSLADAGSSSDSWAVSESGGIIPLPSGVTFAFQQWSYVTDQDVTRSEYSCDATHADCKINFDLSPSFSGGLDAWDYLCSSDFGWAGLTETGKCNPASITFPRGRDYPIRFRIALESDASRFIERSILLHAPDLPVVASSGWGGGGWSTASLAIAEPEIHVQSGLDEHRQCLRSDCALNVEYRTRNSKEACQWEFPGGAYATNTDHKCNPGYVHYPLGNFTVRLRVYEQGNASNYREQMLSFSNGTPDEIARANTDGANHAPVAAIKLQGTLGKTKKQSWQSVTCLGVEECSINLSGEESYDLDRDKLRYEWDFGNDMRDDSENPKAVTFARGNYTVRLRVTDLRGLFSEDTFIVTVEWDAEKDPKKVIPIDVNTSSLRVTGVSPNPYGADGVSEWVEIENPLSVDVALAGCLIDDAPEKGSDPYEFATDAVARAQTKKRWYKLQTRLNFNNTGDTARLVCGGKMMSTISWDYSVPEGFVVTGEVGPYSGRYRTRVIRTIDGDTIIAEVYGRQEKIRLVGVDTPETVDPRKSVQYFGKEASDYTKKMLTGREVELEFNWNPRDKYDRLLAYVWIDGKNFSAELIRLGYARAYLRFPFKYSKEFEQLGKDATKEKMGLWADPEVKKMLDAEMREDKQVLEDYLKEQDKAILDDLITITDDPKIAVASLTDKFLDTILSDESSMAEAARSVWRRLTSAFNIQAVRIVLQGALSKNRSLTHDGTLVCRTKKTCSVNLTASGGDRDWVYRWEIDARETIYGYNPKSYTFGIGSHIVRMRTLDPDTGMLTDQEFHIRVEPLVTSKKRKKSKVVTEKMARAPVWSMKESRTPSATWSAWRGLTPLQASASGAGLVMLGSGAIWMVRRKIWSGMIS